MKSTLFSLLAATILVFASSIGMAAQPSDKELITWQGIPWSISLARAQALFRGLGYEASGARNGIAATFEADFVNQEGITVTAKFWRDRLYGIDSRFFGAPREISIAVEELIGRISASYGIPVVDSGPSDTISHVGQRSYFWQSGSTSLYLVETFGPENANLGIHYSGPDSEAAFSAQSSATQQALYPELDLSRWLLLYIDDNVRSMADRRSVETNSNGVLRLWARSDYSEQQKAIGRTYNYTLRRLEISCASRRFRTLELIFYLDGRVVDSAGAQREEQWSSVIPETVGEALVDSACQKLRR